jgi:hypothetical protein
MLRDSERDLPPPSWQPPLCVSGSSAPYELSNCEKPFYHKKIYTIFASEIVAAIARFLIWMPDLSPVARSTIFGKA